MNPHQKNKVDISSLSPDEQRLFRLYGKLPNKKDLLQNKLKERKYFDSGDYALSKAGKASDVGVTQIGREHPNPENIPHNGLQYQHPLQNHTTVVSPPSGNNTGIAGAGLSLSPPTHGHFPGSSPVKECSFLQRETSADDFEVDEKRKPASTTAPQTNDSVPAA